MDPLIQTILFYVFAALAALFALLVVLRRNPVTSAMSMALSFAATAGIFFLLQAHFLGVVQILVYTGAIVVLIAFVIMTINVKEEEKAFRKKAPLILGILVAACFLAQVIGLVRTLPSSCEQTPCIVQSAEQAVCDLSLCKEKQACPAQKAQLPAINPAQATSVAPTAHIKGQLEQGEFPDTALLGFRLFDHYYITLIIAGLTLLSATVGAVALTRKFNRD